MWKSARKQQYTWFDDSVISRYDLTPLSPGIRVSAKWGAMKPPERKIRGHEVESERKNVWRALVTLQWSRHHCALDRWGQSLFSIATGTLHLVTIGDVWVSARFRVAIHISASSHRGVGEAGGCNLYGRVSLLMRPTWELRITLRRSSNSPRYLAPANLAPAIKAPMSSETSFRPLRDSGTSPATIRCASPSAIAVLPTPKVRVGGESKPLEYLNMVRIGYRVFLPLWRWLNQNQATVGQQSSTVPPHAPGSPRRMGLFFVRLLRIWTVLRISSSRPITGSSFPSRAACVKSRLYFWSACFVFVRR